MAQALLQTYGAELRHFLTRRVDCAETAAALTQETVHLLAHKGDEENAVRTRTNLYRIAETLLRHHGRPEQSGDGSRYPSQRSETDCLNIFLRHRLALIGYATKITGSRDLADDIVQEAWLRLERTAARGGPDHPLAYLYRIVRNLAFDGHRKSGRESQVIRHVDFVHLSERADDAPTPERAMIAKSELERVRMAMADLPERTRKALEMHRFGGLKLREIASELGVSITLAHRLVAEGVEHCKRSLAKD